PTRARVGVGRGSPSHWLGSAPRRTTHRSTVSLGSFFNFDGSPLKISKIVQNSLSAGELPHPSEAEPLPLADIDAERVLDILLAPIDELHHDRVLRVGDRQRLVAPSDAHGMSNRVLRGRPRGRNEIQVALRARVVNRKQRFLRERIPKVIGADAKALAAERLGQAVRTSLPRNP